MTRSGLSMSATVNTTPPEAAVAAQASPDADYLLQWQDDIERFGNAYYRAWHFATVMAMCD